MKSVKGISKESSEDIRSILESSGFFYDFEIKTALELVDETVEKGEVGSGYYWLRIVEDNRTIAFTTFGLNPVSSHSWDLYWIAVHNDQRNKNLGSQLLRATEEAVKEMGGKILWIETSGREQYHSTRHFYSKNGYDLEATLRDFYGPDDSKEIYRRVL